MTTVPLTNKDVVAYGGRVMHNFTQGDYFGTNSMRYFGPEDAEEINQPIVGHDTSRHQADDTVHDTQDAEMVGTDIPLYEVIKATSRVKKTDTITRPSLNYLQNLGLAHGASQAEGKTIRLINALTNVAVAQSNTADAGAVPTSTSVADRVQEIAEAMDDSGMPAMGRYALLRPSAFYLLVANDQVMSKDFGSGGADRAFAGGNNAGVNYLNFDMKNCGLGFGTDWTSGVDPRVTRMNLPAALEADLTNIIGIFWHQDAWALREQEIMTPSIDWIPERQVWQIVSRYHMGWADLIETLANVGGETYAEGIWVMRSV